MIPLPFFQPMDALPGLELNDLMDEYTEPKIVLPDVRVEELMDEVKTAFHK